MKKYTLFVFLLFFFFLVLFLIAEALHLNWLSNLSSQMTTPTIGVALLGIMALVADLFLPMPSSLIMIANGSLFGVFWGTFLSLVGSLGASVVGFWVGRRSQALLARLVSPEERAQANQLLAEWGEVAIIMTRPVPLLAETTVVVAGGSSMRWSAMIWATLAGSLPLSFLYALTGATAANLNNMLLAFIFALLVAGIFWFFGHHQRQKQSRTQQLIVK